MKFVIYGATGQCKVIASILESSGHRILATVDPFVEAENRPLWHVPHYPYHYSRQTLEHFRRNDPSRVCASRQLKKLFLRLLEVRGQRDHNPIYFVVAIGNPYGKKRVAMAKDLEFAMGFFPASVVHPTAIVDVLASDIGDCLQAHAGVIVNDCAKIGDHVILNTRCLVEHDCEIGEGAEIGPGAIVCGKTKIGNYTWVGAGAVIKDHLDVGENSIIGCGAVVVKDVPDNVIVVGNPARELKENK